MPELVYNVKFNIEDPSKATSGKSGAETIITGYNRAEEAAENFGNQATQAGKKASDAAKKAAKDTVVLTQAQNQASGAARRMNASFSTSNQVLFSFSDGIQDASQFSYGFASGMRAVGNNIGFTGELFANLNRRVQEYNQVHGPNATSVTQELKNSLRGPAGNVGKKGRRYWNPYSTLVDEGGTVLLK